MSCTVTVGQVNPHPSKRGSQGFTLLEVLLVINLAAFMYIGFLNYFLAASEDFYALKGHSERLHQLRSGLEVLARELEQADTNAFVLLEPEADKYTSIQFLTPSSPDLYWYYLNSSKTLIRAVKRPGQDWGRTAVAEDINILYFSLVQPGLVEIVMSSGEGTGELSLKTYISPGI